MKKTLRADMADMQSKARSLLTVEYLRNHKCTLKRYIAARGDASRGSYKSINGMPVFDTFEEAKAFRDRLCGEGHFIADVKQFERDFALLQEVFND